MRHDDKPRAANAGERFAAPSVDAQEEAHVVFDFTGLEQPNLGDLSLILTARMQSGMSDNVWVRSVPWRTAQVLRMLRLDHLFRQYPEGDGQLN